MCSWVEPPDLLVDRLSIATQHVPAERIWITTDAGLGALTRAVAIRKVHSMVEAARQMREHYGIRHATPAVPPPANDNIEKEAVVEPALPEPMGAAPTNATNNEITS
jgi:hypothetical protein